MEIGPGATRNDFVLKKTSPFTSNSELNVKSTGPETINLIKISTPERILPAHDAQSMLQTVVSMKEGK